MLIDLHVAPGDRTPANLAAAVAAAGLDGAVIAESDLDRWDAFADAFEALDLVPYLGIALPLDQGALLFVPRDLDDPTLDDGFAAPKGGWTLASALDRLAGLDGAIVAAHPFCRDLGDTLGDRVAEVKGLTAVVTRVGRGKVSWDRQADDAAARQGAGRVGSSGGYAAYLGRAATIVADDADIQEALVEALEAGNTLPIEFDDPRAPRDRSLPGADRGGRRDDRRDDRGGRRDDRGHRDDRGGRRDDRRGPPRRDDRGGRGGDRRGGGGGRRGDRS
ncbi:MAG: hypothetical protein H6706_24635 [Myxococcales bacterium]|nr:hypothetical protein [Myxococcales bacterium]